MTNQDSPQVIAPPPVIFLGGFLLGMLLQWLCPLNLFPGLPAMGSIGMVFAFAAAILALWAFVTLRKGGTNVDPRQPTLTIISSGPFRFTRNPIYLAMALLSLGVALFYNISWAIIALIPVIVTVQLGVIRREEHYLEGKFGQVYLEYKQKVRRWL